MKLFQNASYRFIEKRKTAYVVSAIVLLVGIGAMVANVVSLGSWQNYGVDFLGGSLVQVRFDDPVSDAELREALGGASAPTITQFGGEGEGEFVIRAPLSESATITEVAESVEAMISQGLPGRSFEVVRTELVGAKVGGELQQKALLAVLFSFALTLTYLAMRFELRFGLAAVIATAHDILITLGFLALFRVEIALPTVAAILTILGYSLNDTIVVFDRIRENMQTKGARKRDPVDLVNQSINETLPRTVLTSGTTLAVLFALLILGGAVLRDFTIVLILGVVIGTYSSIFVASPALIEIQKRWGMGKTRSERKKERPQPATV
jgi:preprotein translocase subunit SecF